MKFIVQDDGIGINYVEIHKVNDGNIYKLTIDVTTKYLEHKRVITCGHSITFKFYTDKKDGDKSGYVDIIAENEEDKNILSLPLILFYDKYGYIGYFINEDSEEKIYEWKK